MKKMMKKIVVAAMGICMFAGAANAGTISVFTDTDSIPLQSTNWGPLVLNLDKYSGFDTIDCIKITLTAGVLGNVSLESLDAAPSVVNYNLASTVTATGPGGVNVVALPLAGGAIGFTLFDGMVDFGGTSGAQFNGLSNSDMQMQILVNPLDIANFLGVGTVAFNLNAVGSSFASGAGNLITIFQTAATATVTIDYLTNEIPTPAALPAGLALLGAFALRRRVR